MGSEARGPSHVCKLLVFTVFWTVAIMLVSRKQSTKGAVQWVMPAAGDAADTARLVSRAFCLLDCLHVRPRPVCCKCSGINYIVYCRCLCRMLQSSAPTADAARCIIRHAYVSSELEKAWLGNISTWQRDFCSSLAYTEQLTQAWIKAGVVYHEALQQGHENPAATLEQQQLLDSRIFSQFRTTIDCGSSGSSEQVTWIEPLAHGLRHPDSTCNRGASVFNRTYLMVSHSSEVQSRRQRSQQTCRGRECQAIYLDLGATTLQPGPEEPGQGWFFHTYAKQGIHFDRYLLWEAVAEQPAEVFRHVPKQQLDRYQYFNIPVTADTRDPSNPVHILKVGWAGQHVYSCSGALSVGVEGGCFCGS